MPEFLSFTCSVFSVHRFLWRDTFRNCCGLLWHAVFWFRCDEKDPVVVDAWVHASVCGKVRLGYPRGRSLFPCCWWCVGLIWVIHVTVTTERTSCRVCNIRFKETSVQRFTRKQRVLVVQLSHSFAASLMRNTRFCFLFRWRQCESYRWRREQIARFRLGRTQCHSLVQALMCRGFVVYECDEVSVHLLWVYFAH